MFNLSEEQQKWLTWAISSIGTLVGLYIIYLRDVKGPKQSAQYLNKIGHAQRKIDMASHLLSDLRKLEAIGGKMMDTYLRPMENDDPEIAMDAPLSFSSVHKDAFIDFVVSTRDIKFGLLSRGVQKTYSALLDRLEGRETWRSVDLRADLNREIRQCQHIISTTRDRTGKFSDLYRNLTKVFT